MQITFFFKSRDRICLKFDIRDYSAVEIFWKMIFNSLESPLQCMCFCYFVESFKRSNFFSFNLKSVFTQQSISSRLINNTKCFSSFRPLFITNETNYSVGDENGIYAIALNHNGTQAAVGLGSGNFTVRNIHWSNLKVLSIAYLLKWERNRFVAYFFVRDIFLQATNVLYVDQEVFIIQINLE